jgi:hypothetical protein
MCFNLILQLNCVFSSRTTYSYLGLLVKVISAFDKIKKASPFSNIPRANVRLFNEVDCCVSVVTQDLLKCQLLFESNDNVPFEVLKAVIMILTVLWEVTPCILVDLYWNLEESPAYIFRKIYCKRDEGRYPIIIAELIIP